MKLSASRKRKDGQNETLDPPNHHRNRLDTGNGFLLGECMKTEQFNGHPIRCYDNDGNTFDRYTVIYMDLMERAPNTFTAVGMSAYPFHPQGFGQHTTAMPGKHLGRRIRLKDMPPQCQRLVEQDLLLEDA